MESTTALKRALGTHSFSVLTRHLVRLVRTALARTTVAARYIRRPRTPTHSACDAGLR